MKPEAIFRSLWFLAIAVQLNGSTHILADTNSISGARLPAQSMLTMGGIVTTPERKASPHFKGKEMPLPPEQKTVWPLPVTSMPTNYVTAVAALFDTGMADPRGCEYREIEVGTGNIWTGDGGVVKTRGWLLPGGDGQQFAVCWNGLVYPTVAVGERADWRVDAHAIAQRAARIWRQALPEGYGLSHETCLPLKGCLILRLGEPGLAEELWVAATTKARLGDDDPYLDWASDWACVLFERALCAHMRGDDFMAFLTARQLSSARPRLEAEAERRGFKRQQTSASPWDGKYQDYLSFLAPLPALLADQERRARELDALMPAADVAKLTNQTARISAYIGLLDQVAVRQSGQPGGLWPWRNDAIVSGLLGEKQPAIEPLLQCLEGECGNRLTRSVSFGRDFHRGRSLHPVNQPIVDVVVKLMDASYDAIGINRHGDRSNAVLAAKLRVYWRDFGELPNVERWYRKLADDNAGAAAWADALGNIVRPVKPAEGNTNETKLAGETLRAKVNPTVTELLVRRSETISRSAQAYDPFALGHAVEFLNNSAKWEAALLLPIAAELQERAMVAYAGTQNIGSADPSKASAIARLAMLRARHGDTNGLDAYVSWIEKADPKVLGDSVLDALEPFWRFPSDPALRDAAQSMFASTNSAWGTLAWLLDNEQGFLRWQKPLASPILLVAEFRILVLTELTNRTPGGEVLNRGGGNVEVTFTDGRGFSHFDQQTKKDTERVAVGTKFPFRRCDSAAEQLSAIPGFPQISLLWPQAKRDEAIRETIDLLSKCAHRLRARETPAAWSSTFDPPLIELIDKRK